MTSPARFIRTNDSLSVCAGLHKESGSLITIGNPFVVELPARNPVLATAYHAASSATDRAAFADRFARAIASMAKVNGSVADPSAHARRVVKRLLPDVIHYRPDLPVGFNFANQNGRHPADDTSAVVATMLRGALAPRTSATSFRLGESFPYFPRPADAT